MFAHNGTVPSFLKVRDRMIPKIDPLLRNDIKGTTDSEHVFYYLLTPYDALNSLRILKTKLCFVGHSHVPVTFFLNDQVSFSLDPVIPLDRSAKVIMNTGSVGQPRDDNPLAAFGYYDSEAGFVEIMRAPYDLDTAANKILQAGLPEVLASRLYQGK